MSGPGGADTRMGVNGATGPDRGMWDGRGGTCGGSSTAVLDLDLRDGRRLEDEDGVGLGAGGTARYGFGGRLGVSASSSVSSSSGMGRGGRGGLDEGECDGS